MDTNRTSPDRDSGLSTPHQRLAMVLNVDDDEVGRLVTTHTLRQAGFEVQEAATGEEALRLAQSKPDLVVLDVNLPDIDGFEVCRRLKADPSTSAIPVLHLTGSSNKSEDKIQGLDLGADGYLIEPVEPLELIATIKSLLRLRRAEEAARAAAQQWQAMLDAIGDGVCLLDREGRVSRCNCALTGILGKRNDDVVGQMLQELLGSQSGYGEGVLFSNLRNTDQRKVEEIVLGARWFRVAADPVLDDQGRLIGAICILSDMSDRRKAEKKLREQAVLLEIASNAILSCDLEGRILYWNRGAERLYGWSAAEALGRIDHELLFKEQWPDLQEASERVLETGEWCRELSQVTKEGNEVIVESRWTLVRDEDGSPASRLVINTDITEKKKLEGQFLRAQRMESLGVLAGGISHDLNNVLTPILMAIEFLKMKLPGPENKPLLNTLQDSAERGAAMVKQVLAFARGTEGEHVAVSLRNASKECQRMLEHTLPKSIRLDFSLPGELWLISADATQISQVLMNLCVNARDAMPHGGRLSVTAQNQTLDEYYSRMDPDARPGPYVVLSVSDTGTGIPPKILDRIFDPFFTTKKQGEGTGLGLSTVLGIVKSHGGFVTVYSEVGEGTRFAVYLPALEATALEKTAQVDTLLPRGQGELILVVDDELAICEITKATLEMHGYRALTAGDGAEALAVLMENRAELQLVLTDMSMPVMDGAATIRALRKIEPRLLIIATTGLTVGGQSDVVQAGGVQAFLRKPYTADKLLTTLKEVLDQKSGAGYDSLRSQSQDERSGTCLASWADVS